MPINIAIDGPAGAGKSTLARAAAGRLGFIYADTGALYRAAAYFVLKQGKDPADKDEVLPLLKELSISLKTIDGEQRVFVNGKDVSDKIRTPEVSMGASAVSPIPEVRKFLLGLQKDIAAQNNVIMDGRDIGTVILPMADVKIFLTASAEVRAERRYKELIAGGKEAEYNKVLEEIQQRDYNDSHRAAAPLKKAEDAVLLDTSDMDADEALEKLVEIIRKKCGK